MKLDKQMVKRGLFGAIYLYLDNDTRVRYGFTFAHRGTTYTLQRRKGIFWKEVAFTYPKNHSGRTIEFLINYLKWYEETHKCLF